MLLITAPRFSSSRRSRPRCCPTSPASRRREGTTAFGRAIRLTLLVIAAFAARRGARPARDRPVRPGPHPFATHHAFNRFGLALVDGRHGPAPLPPARSTRPRSRAAGPGPPRSLARRRRRCSSRGCSTGRSATRCCGRSRLRGAAGAARARAGAALPARDFVRFPTVSRIELSRPSRRAIAGRPPRVARRRSPAGDEARGARLAADGRRPIDPPVDLERARRRRAAARARAIFASEGSMNALAAPAGVDRHAQREVDLPGDLGERPERRGGVDRDARRHARARGSCERRSPGAASPPRGW